MRSSLSALALAALAACSSSSPGPQPAELSALDNPKPVRRLWSASVGAGEGYVFSPALAASALYGAGRDGTVVRLDPASGAQRWRVTLDRRLSAGVGADERTVAVATEQGEVLALEAADGKLRWRARVSSEVLAPPTVGGGLVVVRSVDNRVFAFGADDGKRRWVYQRPASSLVVRSPSGMALADETTIAGFPGGKLAAIALANGAVRWEGTVAVPKGTTELERVTDVVGEPVVQGREVCAAAYQGRVACFDMSNGRQIWAREISSATGVSLDPRYAYVSDERGAVQAFDRSSGRSVWKQDRLAHRQLSLPLPVGEVVAVGDFEGYVHFLGRENGAFVARYSTGGGAVRAAPLAVPGGLVVQTQDGGLYALSP
jgi:outer membrane protein assembly factor BamB